MPTSNFKGALFLTLMVGIAFIVGSVYLLGEHAVAMLVFICVGLGIILLAGIGLIFSSLYVRSRGNLAYMRTGRGGAKVIKDHGAIIIGFLHELIPVSLETMKIVVERKGQDALITKDMLRGEVVAEFYIRVGNDGDSIMNAARTLGDKISSRVNRKRDMSEGNFLEAQTKAVTELEREKLIDALRTVAAKRSLHDLNLDRAAFKKELMETVRDGLSQNGLELEDVTISSLDMAPREVLRENNVFDAQGIQSLEKVVAEASVAANRYQRDAELAKKKQDVETANAILEQERELEFQKADQQRQIRTYSAEQNRQAAVAETENLEAVGKRDIEKERVLELEGVLKAQAVMTAEVEKEKSIQTASVQKEQAIEQASVEKQKAVQVAEKQREIAVAQKDAERAKAEELRNEAESAAEAARQKVKTVEITASAEREKQKTIIETQALVEQQYLEEARRADADAYKTQKDAEGRKLAAEADFEAKTRAAEAAFVERTKAAEAAQKSAEAEAAGERAKQMVPVEVAGRQVDVDRTRVETVLKPELAAKAEHEQISVQLTLGQAQISAAEKVGVEFARSVGAMLSQADMKIFGDPETLTRMTNGFSKGLGLSTIFEGFMSSPNMGKTLSAVSDLAKKAGIDVTPLTGEGEESEPHAPEAEKPEESDA